MVIIFIGSLHNRDSYTINHIGVQSICNKYNEHTYKSNYNAYYNCFHNNNHNYSSVNHSIHDNYNNNY